MSNTPLHYQAIQRKPVQNSSLDPSSESDNIHNSGVSLAPEPSSPRRLDHGTKVPDKENRIQDSYLSRRVGGNIPFLIVGDTS
jgi:hypothetical protein